MSSDTQPSKRDRQKARRAERRAVQEEEQRQAGTRRRLLLLVAAVIAVLAVAGIGYLLVQGTDSTLGVEPATVTGEAVPPVTGAGGPQDPGVGLTVPDVTGSTVDGETVTLGATGIPQAVVFMAHWCPHCQQEAPLIADWVDEGRLADGVELVAVSTRQDPARPNWPPDEWLEEANFPGPVLIDPDDAVADTWGLQGTPMWTFLDGEGTIVARYAGQITPDQFAEATALAAG